MVTAAPSKIPFVDLNAQYRALREEMDPVIRKTIEESAFIMGNRVAGFEEAFASFCGARFAVGCSSGTTALHMALVCAGIGAGDEVITTAHTFIATVEAIIHAGAVPVFVDIDPVTYCLDPAALEAAITPKTKAVIPVHLYGQMADMDPILAVAKKHGLLVIEDAAQAHGSDVGGRRAGSLGDFGCFSFYPGKNLGAYGDGGAVTTSDEKHLETLRLLVNHGRETKYTHKIVGYNYRLDGLQAAVLKVKLGHLEDWNRRRRAAAHRYNERLAGLDVVVPEERRGHVYHLYVIQCDDREGMGEALGAEGIASGVHYPVPLHLQPCFQEMPWNPKAGSLPVTEKVASRILSLPMFPELSEEQQDRVAAGVRKFLGK